MRRRTSLKTPGAHPPKQKVETKLIKMEQIKEPETPTTPTEQTVPSKTADELLAEKEEANASLTQKNVELQAQKEHWREKYERDITLKSTEPEPSEDLDVFSDEGKALKGDIKALNEKLRTVERREARREAETEFPFLKDKKEEFDAFLEDEENSRISIKRAAKLFAAENDLLNPEPVRKGLEQPTGGGQSAPETKLSTEEAEEIRKTDYRRYEKLIKEGKI